MILAAVCAFVKLLVHSYTAFGLWLPALKRKAFFQACADDGWFTVPGWLMAACAQVLLPYAKCAAGNWEKITKALDKH
jgi:hypothetical protein